MSNSKNNVEVHINWYGPYSLNEVHNLNDTSKDYGIYQVYGSHPIYGSNVLLYVGKAVQQTFNTRIAQHNWEWNKDGGNIQVYIGRLRKGTIKSVDEWDEQIGIAESIILYACSPARNSQSIKNIRNGFKNIHVFNWGQYRDLLPEISGSRWSPSLDEEDFSLNHLNSQTVYNNE